MSTSNRRLRLDRLQTIRRYYSSPKFALIDLLFGCVALFTNPYRVCRKFNQKRGEGNIYAYGETPFTTYQRIAEECRIGPQDTWVEMGAGRGKGCFWLAHFTRCKVIGIERVPQFVWIARLMKALFRMQEIRFEMGDMETADLSSATLIYLYGNWPKLTIPNGARVVAISEPLPGLTVIKSFWVRYPWGRTAAFLQVNR